MEYRDFQHKLPIEVRFSDIDMLGHVGNVVYQAYYENAVVSYFEKIIKIDDLLGDINYVIAELNIKYLKPVLYPADLVMEIGATAIGRKSIDLAARLLNEQGEICATYRSTAVAFYVPEQVSMPIPQQWRQNIMDYEIIAPRQKT